MQVSCPQNENDLHEIADLKGKIFSRASYYFFYEERVRFHQMDPWFKPEHVRIIKENGRIVSAVTIFERPVRFGKAIIKMAGIGDVLTVPEYRGKRYSRILMKSAVEYMENHNFDLTMLFGIPNYYHKFGYIEAMNYYRLELLNTRDVLERPQFVARQFQTEDIPAMLHLYHKNMKQCNLVVDRSIQYIESKIDHPDALIILTDSNDRVAGYAHTWDPVANKFMVIEAMTENRDASLALLSEIVKRKPSNELTVTIKMSPNMPFVQHVRYLGTELTSRCFGEGEGKAMIAITDLCQLINKFKPLLDKRLAASRFNQFNGKLKIQCSQPVELLIENGILNTCRPAAKDSASRFRLATDLRYFSRNVIGFWSIRNLLDNTDATVTDEECVELLNVLFPETEPFLLPWDYF